MGEFVAARVAIHGAVLVVAAGELGREIFDRIRRVFELGNMHPLVSNDMAGRHEPADVCGRRAFAYVVQLLGHVWYAIKIKISSCADRKLAVWREKQGARIPGGLYARFVIQIRANGHLRS